MGKGQAEAASHLGMLKLKYRFAAGRTQLLHIKGLNPRPLNPKLLNPKPQAPPTLDAEGLHSELTQ